MKRKSENDNVEYELNSLIENVQLMNCFNGTDEFKILKESYKLKERINELTFKEINEIIKKTYLRYKRYLSNVDMAGLEEIENGIYTYVRMYKNETDLCNWLNKYKELLEIMIKVDGLILEELDNYPVYTGKRYKST